MVAPHRLSKRSEHGKAGALPCRIGIPIRPKQPSKRWFRVLGSVDGHQSLSHIQSTPVPADLQPDALASRQVGVPRIVIQRNLLAGGDYLGLGVQHVAYLRGGQGVKRQRCGASQVWGVSGVKRFMCGTFQV